MSASDVFTSSPADLRSRIPHGLPARASAAWASPCGARTRDASARRAPGKQRTCGRVGEGAELRAPVHPSPQRRVVNGSRRGTRPGPGARLPLGRAPDSPGLARTATVGEGCPWRCSRDREDRPLSACRRARTGAGRLVSQWAGRVPFSVAGAKEEMPNEIAIIWNRDLDCSRVPAPLDVRSSSQNLHVAHGGASHAAEDLAARRVEAPSAVPSHDVLAGVEDDGVHARRRGHEAPEGIVCAFRSPLRVHGPAAGEPDRDTGFLHPRFETLAHDRAAACRDALADEGVDAAARCIVTAQGDGDEQKVDFVTGTASP